MHLGDQLVQTLSVMVDFVFIFNINHLVSMCVAEPLALVSPLIVTRSAEPVYV
jgi:hypothetical protein